MSLLKKIIILWLLYNNSYAIVYANDAIKILRDTEIENSLRFLSQNIIEDAGYKTSDIHFIMVNNEDINAFVMAGQQLFFHTGLLLKADYPEELISVIAHEVGHIKAGHIAHLENAKEEATQKGLLAMALGLPFAVLAGNTNALAGVILNAQTIAQRAVFFNLHALWNKKPINLPLKCYKNMIFPHNFFICFYKKFVNIMRFMKLTIHILIIYDRTPSPPNVLIGFYDLLKTLIVY